jgi:hypothetical protein
VKFIGTDQERSDLIDALELAIRTHNEDALVLKQAMDGLPADDVTRGMLKHSYDSHATQASRQEQLLNTLEEG